MSIITPSYAPDLDLFKELHTSVRRYAPADVEHHVLVPSRDVELFLSIDSSRLGVHAVETFLPRGLLSVYSAFQHLPVTKLRKIQALQWRRPWLPVRGWVIQQVAKLSAAEQLSADVVIVADSDVMLI